MTIDFFPARPKTSVAPDYDIDFTTGRGIEKLTMSSPSAGSTGRGKHCLVRTNDGDLAWAPAPAGIHSGWRGIQIVPDLGSYPVGWVNLGARRAYHVGGGYGISWQYPSGAPLPDVSFMPSTPTRTNYAQYSAGVPNRIGWTITAANNHPNWSPYGARRFYNNSGFEILAAGQVWPDSTGAHFEAIVEHGGDTQDTVCRLSVYNHTTSTHLSACWIYTVSGIIANSFGDYYGTTLLAEAGPNGGAVVKLWCGMTTLPTGHDIRFFYYPTGNTTNRSTIIHHIEVRVDETAVNSVSIFTSGAAETVLPETATIEDATIDNGPFTIIADLAPEVYDAGSTAAVVSFGTGLTPLAVRNGSEPFVDSANDSSKPSYGNSRFPATASRVAVRRQMPGGVLEFYSSASGHFYMPTGGKPYTKTNGTKLFLGTSGDNVSPLFYLNRPMKRLRVYEYALTNAEIINV